MKKTKKPVHPGIVVQKEILIPLGLTITAAAKRLGVTRNTLSALINMKSSLSSEMAVRIGKATRTNPRKWLELQINYELWQAEQKVMKVGDLTVKSD